MVSGPKEIQSRFTQISEIFEPILSLTQYSFTGLFASPAFYHSTHLSIALDCALYFTTKPVKALSDQ